ncbi:MAG: 3-phosphoshikimate 1-carboxyvinyltransferase [Ignavibacteriales bacterium]|nr:3-phosphoshikimate 1-carboxyvinyltransferase [Ignavibacteriales bacterium]
MFSAAKISPISKVRGKLSFQGDKSISHRAVMFASLAKGASTIHNPSSGEDVHSTIRIFKQLGCNIKEDTDYIRVVGRGFKHFEEPLTELYAGNSGTTARLMAGILVHQNFNSTLTGDDSLSRRPMFRISSPLAEMGAKINLFNNKTLPMHIAAVKKMRPIKYLLKIPSAQIKSAILISGLFVDEPSTVIEFAESRNHTELMLGLRVEKVPEGNLITVSRKNYPQSCNYLIPGDISSAAFFIVLALLLPDSELRIEGVSLNPTRSGFLKVLREMGADIEELNRRTYNNEVHGDLLVRSSELHNVAIPKDLIPNIIDEIPALTIAGLFSEGVFKITHAKELRVKECDRIAAMCSNLKLIGSDVEEYTEGYTFTGRKFDVPDDITFRTFYDHRIAMSFSILSFLLKDGAKIDNLACINISNPTFFTDIQKISG